MNIFRNLVLVAVSLALGFGAGWHLHQPTQAALPSSHAAVVTAPIAAPTTIKQIHYETKDSPSADLSSTPPPSPTARLDVVRWLKRNGLFYGVQVFNGDSINPQFAALYDLTPTEVIALNQARQQTQQRLDALVTKNAKLDPASTEEKSIITVPPFPVEGGQVYNDFISLLSSTLGADRFASMNELLGDNIERSFSSFGLENLRYEITKQSVMNGLQFYGIRSFNALPANNASPNSYSGTSIGTVQAEELLKNPALKAFHLPTVTSAATPFPQLPASPP